MENNIAVRITDTKTIMIIPLIVHSSGLRFLLDEGQVIHPSSTRPPPYVSPRAYEESDP